jgi:hypothetical protein
MKTQKNIKIDDSLNEGQQRLILENGFQKTYGVQYDQDDGYPKMVFSGSKEACLEYAQRTEFSRELYVKAWVN